MCHEKIDLYRIILYNNTVRPVLCEGWHFTHMWKALA